MKTSKVKYNVVLAILIASVVTAIISNLNSELFSFNEKLIFKAGMVIGFVWFVTRGKSYKNNKS